MKKANNYSGAKKTAEGLVIDLDRHVPYFFTVLSIELSRGAARLYRQIAGIGITEWRIMCILGAVPDISAQQVCEITAIDKAAVSRSLQRLAKLDFVMFNTVRKDSRAKTIRLSGRGREVHDFVIQMALEREEILLSVLTGDERKHLIRSLQKLRSNVPSVNKWKPTAIKHGGGKYASKRS